MIVARELARHKLDLVCVQEVRWEKGGTIRAGDYIYIFFFIEKEMKIINLEQDFLYTTEYYLQLREWSVLVTGCHI